MCQFISVVLCSFVAVVIATMEHNPLDPKPEKYKDIAGCYISNLDKMVPVGVEVTSSDCVLYRCEENWFDFYTCNNTYIAPDCVTVSGPDISKPYPQCCPRIECYA